VSRSCGYGWQCDRIASIKAENLMLRRQLSLYIERHVKPHRINPVSRVRLVVLSHLFNWQDAVVAVRPESFLRWRRNTLEVPVVGGGWQTA